MVAIILRLCNKKIDETETRWRISPSMKSGQKMKIEEAERCESVEEQESAKVKNTE
jgi:hypothetical protein